MKTRKKILIEDNIWHSIPGNKSEFVRQAINYRLSYELNNLSTKSSIGDRRTKKGLLYSIYHVQKQFSRNNELKPPKYTLESFTERWLHSKDFNKMFQAYVDSGYDGDFVPGVYRLNKRKRYSFCNTILRTWSDHREKLKLCER